jgi:hypothetical protein
VTLAFRDLRQLQGEPAHIVEGDHHSSTYRATTQQVPRRTSASQSPSGIGARAVEQSQ